MMRDILHFYFKGRFFFVIFYFLFVESAEHNFENISFRSVTARNRTAANECGRLGSGQSWRIERSSPLPEVPTDAALTIVVEQIFGGAHPRLGTVRGAHPIAQIVKVVGPLVVEFGL